MTAATAASGPTTMRRSPISSRASSPGPTISSPFARCRPSTFTCFDALDEVADVEAEEAGVLRDLDLREHLLGVAADGERVHEVDHVRLDGGERHAASAERVRRDDAVGAGAADARLALALAGARDDEDVRVQRLRRERDVGVAGIGVRRGEQRARAPDARLLQHVVRRGVALDDEMPGGDGALHRVGVALDDDERHLRARSSSRAISSPTRP